MQSTKLSILLILSISILCTAEDVPVNQKKKLNILVYSPIFGHSHCNFMNKISDALVDAGHRVIKFSPIADPKTNRGTTKAEVIFTDPVPSVVKLMEHLDNKLLKDQWTEGDGNPLDLWKMFGLMMDCTRIGCNVVNITESKKKGTGDGAVLVIFVDPISSLVKDIEHMENNVLKDQWTQGNGNPMDLWGMFQAMMKCNRVGCNSTLHNTELLEKLKGYNFDIALSEPMDLCAFGIFELIGIKKHNTVISVFLADGFARWFGVPTAPSYVPAMNSKHGTNMTFLQRMGNGIASVVEDFLFHLLIQDINQLFKEKYGEGFPELKKLVQDSIFVFTNSDPLFAFPSPTTHKIVDIGGISVPPKSGNQLAKEWDSLLSLRPHNVLLSFGSVAKSVKMPQAFKDNIIATFKRFPRVTFVWKYEEDDSAIGVTVSQATKESINIVRSAWVPQTELLGDPRLTAFITHGGAGSVNEATLRGVPTITVPLFSDQYRNAKMMERMGTTIQFEKGDLGDGEKLYEVVNRIINDESLRLSARRLATTIANRPFSPAELLVKYTEFAAYHGPFPQLDTPAIHMGYIQYFLIDVIATVIFVCSIILFAIYQLIKCVVRRCKNVRKVKTN